MRIAFLLVCVAFAFARAEVGTKCTDGSQCDEGECCQILSEFMVVSKKRAANVGTCQRHSLEGESCGVFDKINGYCSCAPGLKCIGTEVPLVANPTPITKKSIIAPKPGYRWVFECSKPTDPEQLQPSF